MPPLLYLSNRSPYVSPRLRIDELRMMIGTDAIGSDLQYREVVDSTNRVAAALTPARWKPGTVVLADYQTAGRGRLGRSWHAPAGSSVMLSVLLQRDSSISPADYVMMAALSVRDAVSETLGVVPEIKWPNDVLLRNRKVAGILCELSVQDSVERVIVGIGINVRFGLFGPESLPEGGTSLDIESGSPIEREAVILALIRALNLWYRGLTHRPDSVFNAWAAALQTIGRTVVVKTATDAWTGTALGVRRDGGLLVETPDGHVRSVYAADVSVRHT